MDHTPCLVPRAGHSDAQSSSQHSGDGGKSISSGSSLATCWIWGQPDIHETVSKLKIKIEKERLTLLSYNTLGVALMKEQCRNLLCGTATFLSVGCLQLLEETGAEAIKRRARPSASMCRGFSCSQTGLNSLCLNLLVFQTRGPAGAAPAPCSR